MNFCALSGVLREKGVVFETSKCRVLRFKMEVSNGSKDNERDITVPCILFNPNDHFESVLCTLAGTLFIEFQGKLLTSKSAVEVCVYQPSIICFDFAGGSYEKIE